MKKGHWKNGLFVVCASIIGWAPAQARADTSGSTPSTVRLGPEGSGADIEVKASAVVADMDASLETAYPAIVFVSRACGAPRPVITSGRELGSRHMRGSLHYAGRAVDVRARDMPGGVARCVRDGLRVDLGGAFYVGYEEFPNDPDRNHVHVEFDPHQ